MVARQIKAALHRNREIAAELLDCGAAAEAAIYIGANLSYIEVADSEESDLSADARLGCEIVERAGVSAILNLVRGWLDYLERYRVDGYKVSEEQVHAVSLASQVRNALRVVNLASDTVEHPRLRPLLIEVFSGDASELERIEAMIIENDPLHVRVI